MFHGGKKRPVLKADNLPPSCAVVTKSGNLNFLEPSGPVQACNGADLPLPYSISLLCIDRADLPMGQYNVCSCVLAQALCVFFFTCAFQRSLTSISQVILIYLHLISENKCHTRKKKLRRELIFVCSTLIRLIT